MSEKMTIHRALAELKLIDSRIEKGIKTIIPTGTMQKGKLVSGLYTKEDFEENAKSKYQSVIDLIERKGKIKSAIVKANSTTTVNIGGVEMTIADTINFKMSIGLKKQLILDLVSKHNKAKENVEKNNAIVEENALKLAAAALSKDNVKLGDNDVMSVTKPFLENNTFKLIDPLEVEKLTDVLQKEVTDFEVEVDATLSEINAITIIKI